MESPILFVWLSNHAIIHSHTVKNKMKGRASSGIMIALNKQKYKYEVFLNTTEILIIKANLGSLECIIVVVYFNQDLSDDKCIDLLDQVLDVISIKFPGIPIIIGGDLNSRMGNLNSLEEDKFTGRKEISNSSKSMDHHINTRGRNLIECFENNGLIVTNGRSYASDFPVKYTNYEPRGFSVIDLVASSSDSLHLILDFKVCDLPTFSDHMTVFLEINSRGIG